MTGTDSSVSDEPQDDASTPDVQEDQNVSISDDTNEHIDAESDMSDPAVEQADEPIEQPAAQPTSLATKRRGQFMDMKHPSADMKSATSAQSESLPSRVGVTLSPLSARQSSDDSLSASPSEVADDAEPTSLESSEDIDTQLDSISNDSRDRTSEYGDDLLDDDDAPTSPFLPDAKVDKRPLGSTSTADDTMSEIQADNERPLEVTAPATVSTQLPKELDSSVLEVEADTTAEEQASQDHDNDYSDDNETTAQPDTDGGLEHGESDDEKKSDGFAAPTSIPPQYSVKEDKVDEAEPQTSLYDDAADHPALVESKKSSHWIIAIVIFLMLLLGAAGGAALYLYQTGTL